MAFSKINDDMNIIQALDDEPNDVGGLTANQLKAKFDQAGNTLKTRINSFIDAVMASSAASNIGFNRTTGVPEDTVQNAIVNVQAQLVDITQDGVADGSITAEKLDEDAFDWTEKLDAPTPSYSSAEYKSNTLKFLYCPPLKKMRVEGYVKFTPANTEFPEAEFGLPSPAPTLGYIPLTASVIDSTLRIDLVAGAKIMTGNLLTVYFGGWKTTDRGSDFTVYVHGEYYCEGE